MTGVPARLRAALAQNARLHTALVRAREAYVILRGMRRPTKAEIAMVLAEIDDALAEIDETLPGGRGASGGAR